MRRALLIVPFLLALLLACATPAERAEKLLKDEKYEEVLERYPNEPAAGRAKEALAARLLKEGNFERILTEFQDTPMYHEAKVQMAEKLLEEGKIDEILADYSDTPAAIRAREAAAQALYDAGRVTEAARDYPQTTAGSTARTELARAEYDRIMTFKDKKERHKLLESFLTNSMYAGTASHAQAQTELAKLDGLEVPGNY
ncbi:MAG: hypothetical protein H6505_03160 [Calditrichaeota bacterium]|nr:hypothetical protein [Calditrichota bacterium]